MAKIGKTIILVLILLALIWVINLSISDSWVCKPEDYNTVFTNTGQLPSGEKIVIFGFAAKDAKKRPASYLAIYSKRSGRPLYRFSPELPVGVNYPRPLMIEVAEIMTRGDEVFILTTWGETGADYIGTHPILIRCKDRKFQAVNFYEGNLSDSPRVRQIHWIAKDFVVTNHYAENEKVLTILTQRVSILRDNRIELGFYWDNKPRAAEHKYVLFTFPLPNSPTEEK